MFKFVGLDKLAELSQASNLLGSVQNFFVKGFSDDSDYTSDKSSSNNRNSNYPQQQQQPQPTLLSTTNQRLNDNPLSTKRRQLPTNPSSSSFMTKADNDTSETSQRISVGSQENASKLLPGAGVGSGSGSVKSPTVLVRTPRKKPSFGGDGSENELEMSNFLTANDMPPAATAGAAAARYSVSSQKSPHSNASNKLNNNNNNNNNKLHGATESTNNQFNYYRTDSPASSNEMSVPTGGKRNNNSSNRASMPPNRGGGYQGEDNQDEAEEELSYNSRPRSQSGRRKSSSRRNPYDDAQASAAVDPYYATNRKSTNLMENMAAAGAAGGGSSALFSPRKQSSDFEGGAVAAHVNDDQTFNLARKRWHDAFEFVRRQLPSVRTIFLLLIICVWGEFKCEYECERECGRCLCLCYFWKLISSWFLFCWGKNGNRQFSLCEDLRRVNWCESLVRCGIIIDNFVDHFYRDNKHLRDTDNFYFFFIPKLL
jgi:hypothetical protein